MNIRTARAILDTTRITGKTVRIRRKQNKKSSKDVKIKRTVRYNHNDDLLILEQITLKVLHYYGIDCVIYIILDRSMPFRAYLEIPVLVHGNI